MTQEHPITPPPNLVQEWYHEADNQLAPYYVYMAHQAARWGADQELEACCKLLELSDTNAREFLYTARRPEPPSLKEQALAKLEAMERLWEASGNTPSDIVRRALEQLND